MPAIIAHDTFGTEVYNQLFEYIGGSRDEADAFLLGNQGPDPLFYAMVHPGLPGVSEVGNRMHSEKPAELLAAMRAGIREAPAADQPIDRAYVLGFLCHYLLDSTAHPLIQSQEYALCDAGVPGLTRENGSDVHAVIESELDELVLTVKRDATIATFNPAKQILRASDRVLAAISALYDSVIRETYGIQLPEGAFGSSVKAFRTVQEFFYSPNGFKHNIIGRIEMLVRPYSFYRAMSHRNRRLEKSQFDNHEHATWVNPHTGTTSTESFFDLFDRAKQLAFQLIPIFDAPSFNTEQARVLTSDLNFSGAPTQAVIVAVETIDAC